MIFVAIIVITVIWGLCNALRELAIYRSLVANQKYLMYASEQASHNAAVRHHAEIKRIAEKYDIQELKHRPEPGRKHTEPTKGGLDNNLEVEQSGESEIQAFTVNLGLSGYLMGIPFWAFHGFFVTVTVSLAIWGLLR